MDTQEESLKMHEEHKGKLAVCSKLPPLSSKRDLSLAYTPGVAEPCRYIAKNPEDVYKYTPKGNMVAIVSDGSAVLGLGNIGAEAAIPVMEGKAILFKEFGGIDAFPICVKTQDAQKIIQFVKNLSPVFGGVNLEDISAPRCFEIEDALQDLGIPVMHDDQHGTAVVVLAAVINALKVVGKQITDVKMIMNGAGAAGIAVTKMLIAYGLQSGNAIMVDSRGIIYEGRPDLFPERAASESKDPNADPSTTLRSAQSINVHKQEMAQITNAEKRQGTLADAVRGADIFIGVSVKEALSKEMVQSMNSGAIVMAMANPDPEIMPDLAHEAGVAVVATGRSDFPNQVNNVLGFPGIFRGALDVRATRITEKMKLAAAQALAGIIQNPTAEEILPYALDKSVAPAIASAVSAAWRAENS